MPLAIRCYEITLGKIVSTVLILRIWTLEKITRRNYSLMCPEYQLRNLFHDLILARTSHQVFVVSCFSTLLRSFVDPSPVYYNAQSLLPTSLCIRYLMECFYNTSGSRVHRTKLYINCCMSHDSKQFINLSFYRLLVLSR